MMLASIDAEPVVCANVNAAPPQPVYNGSPYCYGCSAALPPGGVWYFCGPACEQSYTAITSGAAASSYQCSAVVAPPAADLYMPVDYCPRTPTLLAEQFSNASFASNSSFSFDTSSTPMSSAPTPTLSRQISHDPSLCTSCQNRSCASGTQYCSKRCCWLGSCKCPQCGRGRDVTQVFCSNLCTAQASQANWCGVCGVRQIAPGSTHCSAQCAAAGHASQTVRRRPNNSFSRHQLVSPEDKQYQSIVNQYGHAIQVAAVIKLNSEPQRRKKFLNYRSFVEQTIQSAGVGKYGHGGEGNEQRRLFPISYGCSCVENGMSTPCGQASHSCSVCVVLQHGCSMSHMSTGSHFCVSNADSLRSWCTPNAMGVKAFVVGRVVLGLPQFVLNHSEVMYPAEGFHCTVVDHTGNPLNAVHSATHGGAQQQSDRFLLDDVCVFRDEAVDPQYLVLFY